MADPWPGPQSPCRSAQPAPAAPPLLRWHWRQSGAALKRLAPGPAAHAHPHSVTTRVSKLPLDLSQSCTSNAHTASPHAASTHGAIRASPPEEAEGTELRTREGWCALVHLERLHVGDVGS